MVGVNVYSPCVCACVCVCVFSCSPAQLDLLLGQKYLLQVGAIDGITEETAEQWRLAELARVQALPTCSQPWDVYHGRFVRTSSVVGMFTAPEPPVTLDGNAPSLFRVRQPDT